MRKGELSIDDMSSICGNMGPEYEPLCSALGIKDVSYNKCHICGGNLEELIHRYSKEVAELVLREKVRRFLIGVKSLKEISKREREIAEEFGIDTWESVKSELKRVIGKHVRDVTGAQPDFEEPEAIFIIDVDKGITVERPSILILADYIKLGRGISQMPWVTKEGGRKYPLSVYDACSKLASVYNGSDIVIHAAGREDVDVRMLGTGRSLVIEIRQPRRRDVDLKLVEHVLNEYTKWLRFKVYTYVRREIVRRIKESGRTSYKIYRALVVVSKRIEMDDMERLEKFFHNREIVQRTPRRILRRKKDVVRIRKVFEVKTRKLSEHVFVALIRCEGGLYVKELVDGDGGRTAPSFAEVLGSPSYCAELDVLYVHKQI